MKFAIFGTGGVGGYFGGRLAQAREDVTFIARGNHLSVIQQTCLSVDSIRVDVVVNPTKEKTLTNMRASGSDRNILLKPPRQLTLEMALEYIEDDELVEVTPTKVRLRKMLLNENERRKSEKRKAVS